MIHGRSCDCWSCWLGPEPEYDDDRAELAADQESFDSHYGPEIDGDSNTSA